MNTDKQTLREALARKYPTSEASRQVVHDVGLDEIRIAFQARADFTWYSVLDEASKQGTHLVRALIERALRDYPGDMGLQSLLDGTPVHYSEGPDIAASPWRGRSGQTVEKVFSKQSSLVPVSFLEVGVRQARSVVLIQAADGSLGSGFLVTGDLLVTNHHVLGDRSAAANAVVHFNYQQTVAGHNAEVEEQRLDPDFFFATSREDDCTLVKVVGNPSARWTALDLQSTRVRIDDRVNIIQHPGGGRKQLSFFHNLVVYEGEGRVQYLTDTLPGSSGSPVFDKDWRLVALHHSGGWITEPGSKDRFFRNEGTHVDRIIALQQKHRS